MTQTFTRQQRRSAGIFVLLFNFFVLMAFAASAQLNYSVSVLSPTSGMMMVKGQMYTLQVKVTNNGMSAIPMGDTLMVGVAVNGSSAFMGGTMLMAPIPMGGSQTFNISNFSYSNFTANNDNSTLCMAVAFGSKTNSGSSSNCQTIKLRLAATAVANAAQAEEVLSLYPNPAGASLSIRTAAGTTGSFRLYDMSGRQVADVALTGGEQNLPTGSYQTGLYLYRALDGEGRLLQSGRLSIAH